MQINHHVVIPPPPMHCDACGSEYVNIQHPAKPMGVSMYRACKCTIEFVPGARPGETIVRMVPPKAAL